MKKQLIKKAGRRTLLTKDVYLIDFGSVQTGLGGEGIGTLIKKPNNSQIELTSKSLT